MKKILLTLGMLIITSPCFAFLPVIDASEIMKTMQMIEQLNNEYQLLQKVHQNGIHSLSQLTQEVSDMTGHYGYGSAYDVPGLQNYGSAANTWQSVLNAYQGGGSGDVSNVARTLAQNFPIENASTIYPNDGNQIQGKYYVLQSRTTLASRSVANVSYDRITKEIKMLNELKDDIEHAPNQKAILDLIGRAQIETALVQTQVERLLAVLIQQIAVNSQSMANSSVQISTFCQW